MAALLALAATAALVWLAALVWVATHPAEEPAVKRFAIRPGDRVCRPRGVTATAVGMCPRGLLVRFDFHDGQVEVTRPVHPDVRCGWVVGDRAAGRGWPPPEPEYGGESG